MSQSPSAAHNMPWPWLDKVARWWRKSENLLLVLTITSVVLGSVLGLTLRSFEWSREAIDLVMFPGEILMNLLKMLTIPLIVSSLVSGLAVLDAKSCGRISSYAMVYYLATTAVASVTGIILVLLIRPGGGSNRSADSSNSGRSPSNTMDAFLDLIRNIFPENLIGSCVEQVSTVYKASYRNESLYRHRLFDTDNQSAILEKLQNEALSERKLLDAQDNVRNIKELPNPKAYIDGINIRSNGTNNVSYVNATIEVLQIEKLQERQKFTNVLGLVCFSIFFGIVLGRMGRSPHALFMKRFFGSLNEIIMYMVKLIMWYAPIGICFLIIGKFLGIKNLQETLSNLAFYMLTVVTGLLVHGLVTLPTIFYVCTRRNPFVFMKGIMQAWVTAVGTASSSATLPITFKCLEENLKVDRRVTRFVLPVGATINMDGTALYEAVAAIFIAQRNNIPLGIGQVFTVSLTATLASIGAAAIPSAGLVTMIIVLTSVNLPVSDITFIVTVDWLLDRLRTSINVLGDAIGAGIVAHLCREELARTPPPDEEMEGVGAAAEVDCGYESKVAGGATGLTNVVPMGAYPKLDKDNHDGPAGEYKPVPLRSTDELQS